MDGTRIVLVRHGESRAQELGVVGGHKGCDGLSDLGRQQVGRLRDRLARTGELGEVGALYSSVMPRAVETAQILAPALGIDEVAQECDFCEHHPGEGDGLEWEEFNRLYPRPAEWDPTHRRDPGSETWDEMHERVSRGLDAVLERHAGQTVVVACHGGVVVHSVIRWFGLDGSGRAGRAWISPTNASVTEWRFGANPYDKGTLPLQLVRYNDHAHLTDPA